MSPMNEHSLLAFSTYGALSLLVLLLCYISFKEYENSPTESLHKRNGSKFRKLFLLLLTALTLLNLLYSVRDFHRNDYIDEESIDMLLDKIFSRLANQTQN